LLSGCAVVVKSRALADSLNLHNSAQANSSIIHREDENNVELEPSARSSWRRLNADDSAESNSCTYQHIRDAQDQCKFVRNNCDGIVGLVDFVGAYFCEPQGLARHAVGFSLFLSLLLVMSLLATTTRYFLIPTLDYLSFDVLLLRPEVVLESVLGKLSSCPVVLNNQTYRV
jgi:hypothetical protein